MRITLNLFDQSPSTIDFSSQLTTPTTDNTLTMAVDSLPGLSSKSKAIKKHK
jgi:hypothetical protein